MKKKTQKSVQDFKGWAMSPSQQLQIKGGNGTTPNDVDFIITDDIIDG